MLLVLLEVAFIHLVLLPRVQPSKATLLAMHPLSSVVVTTVPDILSLAVPLIHVELALVIAVLE